MVGAEVGGVGAAEGDVVGAFVGTDVVGAFVGAELGSGVVGAAVGDAEMKIGADFEIAEAPTE